MAAPAFMAMTPIRARSVPPMATAVLPRYGGGETLAVGCTVLLAVLATLAGVGDGTVVVTRTAADPDAEDLRDDAGAGADGEAAAPVWPAVVGARVVGVGDPEGVTGAVVVPVVPVVRPVLAGTVVVGAPAAGAALTLAASIFSLHGPVTGEAPTLRMAAAAVAFRESERGNMPAGSFC